MARSMSSGRKVGRPAQGVNSGLREDAKWSPSPQPAATVVSQGTVSKPRSAPRQATFSPDHVRVKKVINTVNPAT